MLVLYLIIGLRDLSVGPDTPSYVEDFERFARMNYDQMLSAAFAKSEPLYVIISWLASLISDNYIVFLLIWALFPCVALYGLFKRELVTTADYLNGLIVFFVIGLYAFFVAGIRQTAALSIILLAFPYFKQIKFDTILHFYNDTNWIKFLLCMCVAYLIHNSSIFFLFAFVTKIFKPGWCTIFVVIGAFIIGTTVKANQISILTGLLFEERFNQYGTTYESTLSMTGFYMQCILFILCYLKRKKLMLQNPNNIIFMNMMILGLVFQSMTGLIAEMYRVSFFFSMFGMVLVPRAMACFSISEKGKLFNACFVALSLVYLFILAGTSLPMYSSSI